MEDASHEVLDISSDEEEEMSEQSNWLECLLDKIERADSDEVVVLGSSACEDESSKPKDELDDECLILDGDPDKPTEVASEAAAEGSDGDDLLVVSEKGQIACRDYPHPRHLCARYPFSTNPHEKFCDLCHCYVCDIQAPCIYWGSGASFTDHCHSNDKEEIWRLQRKCNKQGIPAPTLNHPSNAYLTGPPLQNSIPAVVFSQPLSNRNTQLHVLSRSNTLPRCSPVRNYVVPSISSHVNHHRSRDAPNKIKLPIGVSRSTSFSPSSSTANRATLDKVNRILGPRFVSPHVNFKRVGSAVMTKARSVHSSYGNNNQVCNTYLEQQLQQPHQQPHRQVHPQALSPSQAQPHRPSQAQPQAQPHRQSQAQPHRQSQSHQRRQAQAQAQPQPHRQLQPQTQIHHTPASYNNIQGRSQVLGVCSSTLQQQNNYPTTIYEIVQPNVHSTRDQEVTVDACQVGPQSANDGSYMDRQPHPIPLQSEVSDQHMLLQPTDNVESYLVEDPNNVLQTLTNYELNFLNDSAQSLVSAVQYPEPPSTRPISNPSPPSTRPISNPSPAIETVPQCPVTANLSANFDLETWINSLDDVPPPDCGKEAIASPLGFIPVQSDLPEEALWFDFENLQNYI